jgi:hypothetical protein
MISLYNHKFILVDRTIVKDDNSTEEIALSNGQKQEAK